MQIIRRILVPEMTMLVLPASVNMTIILMKETATLSIVTVPELTHTISSIGTEFYAFVECLFLLALFYWGLTEICAWFGRIAEARLSRFRFATA
jgi:polar amino acid transport system permease protein